MINRTKKNQICFMCFFLSVRINNNYSLLIYCNRVSSRVKLSFAEYGTNKQTNLLIIFIFQSVDKNLYFDWFSMLFEEIRIYIRMLFDFSFDVYLISQKKKFAPDMRHSTPLDAYKNSLRLVYVCNIHMTQHQSNFYLQKRRVDRK